MDADISRKEEGMMPLVAIRRRMLPFALAWVAAPLAASPADFGQILTGEAPSVRQTEQLAKKADALIGEVEEAQLQVRAALDAYNALVRGGASDLRKPYRNLDREIERCEKRREAVQRRADDAKKEADAYFRGWAASLPLIASEDLRGRSEARMRDSRTRFDGILAAGRRAATEYEPFLVRLRDQWTYLGHDLNPSGLESLRPDAQELTESGTQLLVEIESSLREARSYVASIRSIQPPPPPPPPAPKPPAGTDD